jgi:hypothetical protein
MVYARLSVFALHCKRYFQYRLFTASLTASLRQVRP